MEEINSLILTAFFLSLNNQGTVDIPMKKRHDVKKACTDSLTAKFAEEPRIVAVDSAQDADQLLRFALGQKVRISVQFSSLSPTVQITQPHLFTFMQLKDLWRDKRPYLLVEGVNFTQTEENFGVLSLSGYLRGNDLDVNGLIHLSGYGDFQIERIDSPKDPHPYVSGRRNDDMGDADVTLAIPNPEEQASLRACNIPDELANEQTWPTDEELEAADSTKVKKARVPKGMSAYQAAWIAEAFEGEGAEGDDDDDEDGAGTRVDPFLSRDIFFFCSMCLCRHQTFPWMMETMRKETKKMRTMRKMMRMTMVWRPRVPSLASAEYSSLLQAMPMTKMRMTLAMMMVWILVM
jgi:hypothetical protein